MQPSGINPFLPSISVPTTEPIESEKQLDAESLFRRGEAYEKGDDVSQSIDQAVACYITAAEMGHPGAQFKLGIFFLKGNGVEKNESLAVSYFERAVDRNHDGAMLILADCYMNGVVVPQDITRAVKLVQMAAQLGNSDAMIVLYYFFTMGIGVSQDRMQAIQFLRQAAEKGNHKAEYLLGATRLLPEMNLGYDVNLAEVKGWLRCAADSGFHHAQCLLGGILHREDGADKNKGKELLQHAARQGNAVAIAMLAEMSLQADDGLDVKKAVRSLSQAQTALSSEIGNLLSLYCNSRGWVEHIREILEKFVAK
jgi:TPR repeat protein